MSTDQAHQLIERLTSDADFRERLESAPLEQRREILASEGFGDVRLRHISQALPESAGGELTDEEFAAVAGGSLEAWGEAAGATLVTVVITSLIAAA